MQLDIKNWERVPKEIYEMMLADAIKKEDHVNQVSQNVTDRSYTLIGFLIPTIGVFLSPLYKISDSEFYTLLYIVQLSSILCLAFAFLLLVLNIRIKYLKYPGGAEPIDIAKPEYLSPKGISDSSEIVKSFLLTRIEISQDHITANKQLNTPAFRRLKMAIYAISLGLAIGLIFFLLNHFSS